MDTDHILEERFHKLRMEIESAKRMRRMGINPIDALDKLVSDMIQVLRESLTKKFPHLSMDEINLKIRKQMEIYKKNNISN